MLRRVVAIRPDRIALLFEMSRDQTMHRRVGDPMRRMHDGRRKAACDLVLAAGARFETPESLAQAVGDPLVEAQLEMQAVILAGAALLLGLYLNRWIVGKIGGTTGDTYGFVNQVTEVFLALLYVLITRGNVWHM